MGSMISRIHKELTADDIAEIANTYHAWRRAGAQVSCSPGMGESDRGESTEKGYEDVAGFCKSATLDDIKANDYVLTPGRYVGAAEIEDDGELFEEKMQQLTQTLFQQMAEAQELDAVIKQNLKGLGYGE
jgi:type I restriction enzyme M protein